MLTNTEFKNLCKLSTSLDETNPQKGSLRVWHIPQVPGTPFYVAVKTPEQGKYVLDILAAYDAFQLVKYIKPDYSNAGGLEIYLDNEWCEWHNDNGYDINYLDLDGEILVEFH